MLKFNLVFHEVEQGTPEWLALRVGKLTASNATCIGNNGKGLETYTTEVSAEEFSSAPKESFSTKDTERGKELEPLARQMYELEKNCKVVQVGFVEAHSRIGCSPDGLVGEKGGTEIKCHNDIKHFKMILNGEKEIPSDYIWQCQMNMLITNRDWWDLIFFNPNFQKDILIFRIRADKTKQDALMVGLEAGVATLEENAKIMATKLKSKK